jgi:hypothetical protein
MDGDRRKGARPTFFREPRERTDPACAFGLITKPGVMRQAIASILLKREFSCCGSDRSGAEGDA